MSIQNFITRPIWRRYSLLDAMALPLTIVVIGGIVHFVYTNQVTSNRVEELEHTLHTHSGLRMTVTKQHSSEYIAICDKYGFCTYYTKIGDVENVKNNK